MKKAPPWKGRALLSRSSAVGGQLNVVVVHHLVAAVAFAVVQGGVGVVDEIGGDSAGIAGREADRDGDLQPVGFHLDFAPLDFAPEIFQHLVRACVGGVAQDDQKLLAAPAGDGVGRAEAFGQHMGDERQHLVPHRVTIGVVHVFEKIDVGHGDKGALAAKLIRKDAGQDVLGVAPVPEPG